MFGYLLIHSFFVSAIVDALSDPKKFLTIAEKRADQMKALGIDTVLLTTNTHLKLHFDLTETLSFPYWFKELYPIDWIQPVLTHSRLLGCCN